MEKRTQNYLIIRTTSTAIAVAIFLTNLWLWGYFPGDLASVHPSLINRALIYAMQTFLYAYLGFFLADGVARFWWHRWTPARTNAVQETRVILPTSNGGTTTGVLHVPATLDREGHDQGGGQGQDQGQELASMRACKWPLLIISYGLNDTLYNAEPFAQAFAAAGYAVLTWDYRGRGNTRGKITDFTGHVADLEHIIGSWKPPGYVDRSRVHLCGWSLGGMVSIVAGFTNPDVKKIFAWSTWADLKRGVLRPLYRNPFALLRYLFKGQLLFPDDKTNENISPAIFLARARARARHDTGKASFQEMAREKLFLCHARNDDTIAFSNFESNVDALDLPVENTFVFNKGSHLLARKETIVLGLALRFFSTTKEA